MILVYLLFWAFSFPITGIYLAIVLNPFILPITLLITYYYNKKDYSKEEIKEGTKSEEFQVIGFKKKSFSFLFLLSPLLIYIITGWEVFLLLTSTAFIFILFPRIYKAFYLIPRTFLFLSYPFFAFLNYIPGINLAGEWFIEKDSEIRLMKTPKDILKFVISNIEPFFILNVGISALLLRIILFFKGDPGTVNIIKSDIITTGNLFSIFLVVPLIMSIYFSWVWVWDDAEIKVAKAKISTGSHSFDQIKETTLLLPASDSIKRLFSYAFGFAPILWLVDRIFSQQFTGISLTVVGFSIVIVFAFLISGFLTIVMGIMYFRSGVHEYLVNRIRKEIKTSYKQGNSFINVCNSGIQKVEPDLV